MAANSNGFIRVRLFFDYPPPAASDCRMCWLLVDLNACRVVADLESIIREKFDFSSRSILNLFVDDCYLPHTERILVVRDNDSVRVKVDTAARVNGHSSCPDTASRNCRKRQRPTEDDGPVGNGVSEERKEKKRKKKSKEGLEAVAKQASGDESKKSQGKHKEKKKKKKATKENSPVATPKPAASIKKNSSSVDQPVKSTKKPQAAPTKTQSKKPTVSSSDSSSSTSEEDEAPKKPLVPKPAPKTPLSTSAASKAPPVTKPPQKKARPSSSSSSDTDSSSDEAPSVKVPPKCNPLTSTSPKSRVKDNLKTQQAPSVPQSTNCAQKQAAIVPLPPGGKVAKPCDSDSEEEIELIIRKPMQQQRGRGVGAQSFWRGCSRGRLERGGRGERGRGEGGGVIRGHTGSLELNCNGAKEPSYQADSLTNKSVVIQNKEDRAPKQDYSTMPLLAAPPQVGQKIAFKLLELAENYTPEVSEYKEGRIVSFDPTTKQIELELLHVSQASVEPGKFDLVYQNADGSESVEYAVSRGAWVTERWDSLLEPRLLI
ncbi:putative coilin [Scophthalmus maximus]|uniref:Putative coilin n=1 Tax=Scophthalmus maximus TaxID=52904 RepID=A0A2U9CR04_SCOMX|nr:putative coilin [Scophthalmus maximus]